MFKQAQLIINLIKGRIEYYFIVLSTKSFGILFL